MLGKLLLSLCIAVLPATAQPGFCYAAYGTPGSSVHCPATGSPTVQTYIANVNTFLNATWPGIFAMPTRPIPSDLQMVGMSANWIENCPTTGTCVYNSASVQEAFTTNIVEASGATGVVWNVDYMPWMLSSAYTTATGNSCAATYTTATCTRLQNNLTFYRTMLSFWQAQGLTIRLAPISFGVPGGGSPWLICGLNPATMTVTQRLACEEPYLAAMVADTHARAVSLNTVIVAHEPTEGDAASTGQTLSTSDWNTLVAGLCGAVHGATGGSGVLCSAGYTMADGAYVTATLASVPSGMQVFGNEIYFRSPDSSPSWSNQPAVYSGWAASAIAAGLTVQVDESGPPGYCPNGSGTACQSELINGCGWPSLETYGVMQSFWKWLFRYSAGIGATRTTLFYDQPFALLQTGSCGDNTPTTSYTWQMLSAMPARPTVIGDSWKASGAWGNVQIGPGVTFGGGKVHVQ